MSSNFGKNLLLVCCIFVASRNREKFTNPLFWDFKVVQGHRCWYPRKAHQQCLLW